MTDTVAILTALTALAAVVFAPLISIYVTNKQINASTVSANRQAWINQLRNELAALITIIRHVPSAYHADTLSVGEAIGKHGEMTNRVEVVKLLINPGETNHKELVRLIESASIKVIDAINAKHANATELEKAAERIVDMSRLILKTEWVRVKNGT